MQNELVHSFLSMPLCVYTLFFTHVWFTAFNMPRQTETIIFLLTFASLFPLFMIIAFCHELCCKSCDCKLLTLNVSCFTMLRQMQMFPGSQIIMGIRNFKSCTKSQIVLYITNINPIITERNNLSPSTSETT